jgi:GntR family transcriptional regulator
MAPAPPRFNPGSHVPLYVQLADFLTGEIESGRLKSGAKLPAERDLADQVQLSYGTIRRCMELLRERGLIVTSVGKGTFVR